MPLFSIIIPTHNAAATLNACLNSIVSQAFDAYEVLIIDAISSDGTIEIAEKYMRENDSIHLISEKDKGIYDAMNKGIAMAKGEWLYFLGSDDSFINDEVLKSISENLDSDCDIVYGNTIWLPGQHLDRGEKSLQDLLQFGINHQRVFYRKTLFLTYGMYNVDYKIAADFDLNIRFFCNKEIKSKYVNLTIAYYNSQGISATEFDDALWKDWRKVFVGQFSSVLPSRKIYPKMRGYTWYALDKKNYREAFTLFFLVYFNTFSYSFLKQGVSQVLKRLSNKK